MPAKIETRKVSLAKWWNPFTWGQSIEEKTYYFTFNTLEEVDEFLSGKFNERILHDGISLEGNNLCPK